ncbi:hypothetical protein PGT21_019538 [Puccinia graminis f. sp. tritici]|uniref:Uncharacterized protein n=1 Tax=Puccinia graminis f. sp. tritici TaxID=56615 RepID=A0A5B0QJ17_PUCGR|nr:hypothetical protein PGT21_019538 [Puccinia graminis f. sp. tritici]
MRAADYIAIAAPTRASLQMSSGVHMYTGRSARTHRSHATVRAKSPFFSNLINQSWLVTSSSRLSEPVMNRACLVAEVSVLSVGLNLSKKVSFGAQNPPTHDKSSRQIRLHRRIGPDELLPVGLLKLDQRNFNQEANLKKNVSLLPRRQFKGVI